MAFEWKLFDTVSGNEIIFPAGSRRRVNVSVEPIENGTIERDIYGNAVWMGDPAFWRNRIRLSCSGFNAAPLSKVWVGQWLTLQSPKEESVPGPSADLNTDAVSGSCYGVDANDNVVGYADPVDKSVTIPGSVSIRYRPIFECIVVSRSGDGTQGNADDSWSLTLEERSGGEEELEPVFTGGLGGEVGVVMTGGTVEDFTDEEGVDWRMHTLLSTATVSASVEGYVLVEMVGGGGGGGAGAYGGGGGSGEYTGTKVAYVRAGSHTGQVGSGGAGSTSLDNGRGAKGGTTAIFGLSAEGGGGGGSRITNRSGGSGGSGGGAGVNAASGTGLGKTRSQYGENGGTSQSSSYGGSGGGGAIAQGSNPDKQDGTLFFAGDGGAGIVSNFGPTPLTICGGGGGGGRNSTGPGAGGSGIGGTGGTLQGLAATHGAPNTGSGGGGGGNNTDSNGYGGNGGAGFIRIKYRI